MKDIIKIDKLPKAIAIGIFYEERTLGFILLKWIINIYI